MKRMRDRFDTVVASVNIVAHEEVICVRRLAADAEKLHKVVELTVDVAAYSHRTFHLVSTSYHFPTFGGCVEPNISCLWEASHLQNG